MTSIRKTLNDLAENNKAVYDTPTGSVVALHDDQAAAYPVKVTIDGHWFNVVDLRKTAKLFNKLADQLDSEGRGQ